MKRLNPKTNKPFERKDVREDGYIFVGYRLTEKYKNGFFRETWSSPQAWEFQIKSQPQRTLKYYMAPKGRAKRLFHDAKKRAKKHNLDLSITEDWIAEKLIAGVCELTGLPFDFSPTKDTHMNLYAPSLDRIKSSKGYTKENVRVVLNSVNMAIGEYGDEQMLPILKAMVKGIENAQKKSTTPVSTGFNQTGQVDTQSSTLPTTRTGEDSDDAHHHCGADARKDADCGAQASSGDSVGHGGAEVGALGAPQNSQNIGHPKSTVGGVEKWFERVRSQSGELDLAIGTASKIRQFGD